MLTPKTINEYIKRSAGSASFARGVLLYNQGAIRNIDSNNKHEIIADVQGTYLYQVIIRFNDSIITESECSCPYNRGGICKHQVAVLTHVKLHTKKLQKTPPNTPANNKKQAKGSVEWILIPDYLNLTRSKIKKLASKSYQTYYWQNNVILQEFKENYIKFGLREPGKVHSVHFKFENDILYSKCDCYETTQVICEHQYKTLDNLIGKGHLKIFDQCKPEIIREVYKNVALDYGLDSAIDAAAFFEIDLHENRLFIKPKDKIAGILSSDLLEPHTATLRLSALKPNNSFISKAQKAEEQFELAYILIYHEDAELIDIKIVTGKLNKSETKIGNPIREYDDYDAAKLPLTDDDLKLNKFGKISYTYILSEIKYRDDRQEVAYKTYADILPEMREILSTKRFCYLQNSKEYNFTSGLIPVRINTADINLSLKLTEDKVFYHLSLIIQIENEIFDFSDFEFYSPYLLKNDENVYFATLKDQMSILDIFDYHKKKLSVSKSYFYDFYTNYVEPLSKKMPLEIDVPSIQINSITINSMRRQLYISELGNFIIFKPTVLYNNQHLANVLERGDISNLDKNVLSVLERNAEFEEQYYQEFKALHPSFLRQFNDEFLYLNYHEFTDNHWFIDTFSAIKDMNVDVFGIETLKRMQYSYHKAQVNIQINSGQDWFDLEINVNFGDEEISLSKIRKAILRRENFVMLANGKKGILPEEWIKRLERFFRQGQVRKNELKISKLRFNIIDELFDEKNFAEIVAEAAARKKRLKEFTEIKNVRKPQKLKGELRDYQKSGYNWLHFLDEFGWGGILADDMGLGKTVQMLAFLLRLKSKSKQTNLIIVPTTLLFNWENEIEKFAPDLKPLFHYGTTRTLDTKEFKEYDLVITTYGILTRDIEILQKYKFGYVILDESQAIKNPASLRFKASTLLKAKNRIALTGTPIENNTFDLYAQMEFLNPGLLGTQQQFKENYSDAIDKEQNPVIAAELQNLVNPFILRRTKEQVATELPSKTEDYIFCQMDTEQRKVYDYFKNYYRDLLLGKIEEEGLNKSKMAVLEGLTKLRQICDSPVLLPDDAEYTNESVKMKELIKHIKEKTGNHKILIFSQFVKMLKLIRNRLEVENVVYEYLDGQSTQKARQASVDTFQQNSDIRVFLISLKAGGTGINLTAADYVYIVDPWWNPAVENQAIDRCYRIGQDKKVIAYRMICKDTIEEKIMKYQAKKQKIASDIITTDDSFVKQLDKNAIEDLFS